MKKIAIVVVSIFLLYLSLYYFFTAIEVNGNSMYPTYRNGSSLVVLNKPVMGTIKKGDIITYNVNGDSSSPSVKRVVGVPGETLDISIKGLEGESPVLLSGYYVLGDNVSASRDSRRHGQVKKEDITGKVWFCMSGCAEQ